MTDLRDNIVEALMDAPTGKYGVQADAILALLEPAPLVRQRNGTHWAGGYGYVIRKFSGQYTMTCRNQFDRQFDTIEEAKDAAQAHHRATWCKAGGLET